MKKIIYCLVFSVVIAVGFASIGRAYAANIVPECSDPAFSSSSTCSDVNQVQTTSNNRLYGPDGILTKAASLITYIGGIAAIIMIILGAFTFITGSGDPNALAAARKTIIYAVVGLVVLVLPSAIIRFVISRL